MAFYRKIPVVIEAMHYDGANIEEVLTWMDSGEAFQRDGSLFIRTLEGDMKASANDYVIRGVEGEYYPCRPSIFDTTYEAVDDVYDVLEAYEHGQLSRETLMESFAVDPNDPL